MGRVHRTTLIRKAANPWKVKEQVWQHLMGSIPEPYNSQRPVVCFDETSKQLVAEKRSPIRPKPGRRERFYYEYKRNGTPNLFMSCGPRGCWRHLEVTERRTMEDFAHQMRWLVDEAYPTVLETKLVGLSTLGS